jgi:hypothetical protein
MTNSGRAGLDRWLAMRNLTLSDVQAEYKPAENAIEPNVSYYNLTGVTRVQTRAGNFHFRDGSFALLYSEARHLRDLALNRETLLRLLGKPEATLFSRAGRGHQQYIFPEKGIAFSAGGDDIDFLEIFPSTDLETYKATYYKEPKPFRR